VNKPRGVVVLSVVFAALGLAGIVLGAVFYLSPYLNIIPEIEERGAIRSFGVELAFLGAAAAVTSYGLWNLRSGARILALALCGLHIVSSVIGLISLAAYMCLLRLPLTFVIGNAAMLFSLAVTSLSTMIAGVIIWYLFKAERIFKN